MGEKTYAVISVDGTGADALQTILTVASDSKVRLESLITNEIVKNALDGLMDVLDQYQPKNSGTAEKTK